MKARRIKAWGIQYSKKKGGLCHFDWAFNDMPALFFKRKTALIHARDRVDVVPCEIIINPSKKKS